VSGYCFKRQVTDAAISGLQHGKNLFPEIDDLVLPAAHSGEG